MSNPEETMDQLIIIHSTNPNLEGGQNNSGQRILKKLDAAKMENVTTWVRSDDEKKIKKERKNKIEDELLESLKYVQTFPHRLLLFFLANTFICPQPCSSKTSSICISLDECKISVKCINVTIIQR